MMNDERWRHGWTARRDLWKPRETTWVSLASFNSSLKKNFPCVSALKQNIKTFEGHEPLNPHTLKSISVMTSQTQHSQSSTECCFYCIKETKPHTSSDTHHERHYKQGAPLWWSLPVYIHCLLIKCCLHCRINALNATSCPSRRGN